MANAKKKKTNDGRVTNTGFALGYILSCVGLMAVFYLWL